MLKKILVITDHFGPHTGGAHAAVSSTVYQLLKLGLKIKLIYSKDNFNKRNINFFLLIKNSDIVHFFGAWTWVHIKSIFISLLLRKKIIITPMGAFEEWSLSQKKLKKKIALLVYQKFILRNSNLIHCTSEIEEKNIKINDKKIKTKIISHGLDGTDFKKNKIQNKKIRKILFFSRIHKKKGLLEIINAWSILRPKNWQLDIIGPPGDETAHDIKKLIIEKKLTKRIFIKDPIFENFKKKELFKKYDVSILFSKNENFGYSILESLKHSIPVITTNNTPWDKIKNYNAGWYINYKFQDLVETLNRVFKITNIELLKKVKMHIDLVKSTSGKK